MRCNYGSSVPPHVTQDENMCLASSPSSVMTPSNLCDMMMGLKTTNGDEKLLIEAAARGADGEVHALLEAGVNPNKTAKIASCCHPVTPLAIAAVNGHAVCVTLCLQKGAIPDTRVGPGYTALYCACLQGATEVVRLLLMAGASVAEQDNWGATPLYVACQQGHVACVELLLHAGGVNVVDVPKREGATGLMIAAHHGNAALVDLLLRAGANAHAVAPVHGCQRTALDLAVSSGHSECVALLGGQLGGPCGVTFQSAPAMAAAGCCMMGEDGGFMR
jgi:ankyrin repeat protein